MTLHLLFKFWNAPFDFKLSQLILKFDKSKEIKEVQSENIYSILFNLLFLKPDKFKDIKLEQPENISFMFFTFSQLKLDTFKSINDEQ